MNTASAASELDGPAYLRACFSAEQSSLTAKISLANTSITHSGKMGEVNEQHFIEFLRRHLPRRYSVDSAIVIDSQGSVSDQIDIVIYDNQYTPILLGQHGHHFVPAEAVYGVIEVKPQIDKSTIEYAGGKAASVRKLHRTTAEIPHAGGKFAPKEPFPIFAGLVAARRIEWEGGINSQVLLSHLQSLDEAHHLDFGLALEGGHFDFFERGMETTNQQNALGFFLFRLLDKLQSLGTTPAADWKKYADVMRQLPDLSTP
ncbi:hypothetical protein WH50_17740 [Pokkaliibacter plantistimulans]|uniref:DUF6602 domain-containing protein n=1 Tax=Pokkaliibacter plantistimulans TaxID=1635171 RepID=A0ABX5LTI1_9GAMM|nr:DUF6602 domain-containing protein [Pokkaliibacter plantistimulans]PXF29962.1 hypothetical protein WH50_17740 [Pokkaliibacter plantistimulans]